MSWSNHWESGTLSRLFLFMGLRKKKREEKKKREKRLFGSCFWEGVLMNLALLRLASIPVHTHKHIIPRPWAMLSHMALLNYFSSETSFQFTLKPSRRLSHTCTARTGNMAFSHDIWAWRWNKEQQVCSCRETFVPTTRAEEQTNICLLAAEHDFTTYTLRDIMSCLPLFWYCCQI